MGARMGTILKCGPGGKIKHPFGRKAKGILVAVKMPWEFLDEARFHSFVRGMDLSHYVREAVLNWNKKHRPRPLTPEQDARLKAIGGWPSREEQERRIDAFKGKNSGRGFNEWLCTRAESLKPNLEPTEALAAEEKEKGAGEK